MWKIYIHIIILLLIYYQYYKYIYNNFITKKIQIHQYI